MLTNTKNNKKTIRTIILLICLIIITFLIFVANKQYTNNIKGIEQELIKGENILKSAKVILASYYISIVIFIVLIIYLIGREKKELNEKGVYNRISRILGDSYYAVYLVNFEKESYTIIKGAEYIEDVMPKYGKYEELIDCFEAVIEKDEYEEFREIFSIKNIRILIKTGEKNYGGDFKR